MKMGRLRLKWVGHLWLKWVGHVGLNRWDIYSLNGWGIYGKVSYCFLGDMFKITLVFRGDTVNSKLTLP